MSEAVFALHLDATPLAGALSAGPVTLTHGDLATVNMAFEGDRLILLDWAMPTAAPGALDVARFLVGCAHVVDLDPDEFIDIYRRAAGPAYDETSMQLALLSALCWLGWNKALDIVESQDAAVRERERASLAWWIKKARTDSREWSIVMDLETLYRRTIESWTDRILTVGPEQWGATTPCLEWDVRALVNHVVGEDLWTEPLVRGATIQEVGDRFDGDLLGSDPRETALDTAERASRAVAEALPRSDEGASVLRRRGPGGVRLPAGRGPPDPRVGPRRGHRR